MWRCKKCSGEILMIRTTLESKTYRIKKNEKQGKLIDKGSKETYGINYYCDSCGVYYKAGEELGNIAYWEGNNEKN